MEKQHAAKNLREQLIAAGLRELNTYGLQKFSVRRVASACGVSCAAPYKHFEDKQTFIVAIMDDTYQRWVDRYHNMLLQYEQDQKKQLIEISIGYIRFLVENPYFRSIIMLKDEELDKHSIALRGDLSKGTKHLIEAYRQQIDLPEEIAQRKVFLVRSLIYGAALMMDTGEMEYSQENLDMIAALIQRECDSDT